MSLLSVEVDLGMDGRKCIMVNDRLFSMQGQTGIVRFKIPPGTEYRVVSMGVGWKELEDHALENRNVFSEVGIVRVNTSGQPMLIGVNLGPADSTKILLINNICYAGETCGGVWIPEGATYEIVDMRYL